MARCEMDILIFLRKNDKIKSTSHDDLFNLTIQIHIHIREVI